MRVVAKMNNKDSWLLFGIAMMAASCSVNVMEPTMSSIFACDGDNDCLPDFRCDKSNPTPEDLGLCVAGGGTKCASPDDCMSDPVGLYCDPRDPIDEGGGCFDSCPAANQCSQAQQVCFPADAEVSSSGTGCGTCVDAPFLCFSDLGCANWDCGCPNNPVTEWISLAGSACGPGLAGVTGARNPSIIFNPNNNPAVAFVGKPDSAANETRAYVLAWDGAAWIGAGDANGTQTGVADFGELQEKPSLVLRQPSGTLKEHWLAWKSGPSIQVRVHPLGQGSWEPMPSGSYSLVNNGNEIVLGAAGSVVWGVARMTLGGDLGKIRGYQFDGSDFAEQGALLSETIGPGGAFGFDPEIAVNADGWPFVAWLGAGAPSDTTGSVTVAWWQAATTTWLEEGGNLPELNANGSSSAVAIAVDPAAGPGARDVPWLAYACCTPGTPNIYVSQLVRDPPTTGPFLWKIPGTTTNGSQRLNYEGYNPDLVVIDGIAIVVTQTATDANAEIRVEYFSPVNNNWQPIGDSGNGDGISRTPGVPSKNPTIAARWTGSVAGNDKLYDICVAWEEGNPGQEKVYLRCAYNIGIAYM